MSAEQDPIELSNDEVPPPPKSAARTSQESFEDNSAALSLYRASQYARFAILPNPSHPSTSPSSRTKGWTGKTPISFDQYFPLLPAELRIRVWEFCCFNEPRVIELEPDWESGSKIVTRRSPPSILHVYQESRIEGLKFYKALGIPGSSLDCVWVNFEIDTIIFGHKMFTEKSGQKLIKKWWQGGTDRLQHNNIRNLGMHYSGCLDPETVRHEVQQCFELEKFYVVFDDYPRYGRFQGVPPAHKRPEMTAMDVLLDQRFCTLFNVLDWQPNLKTMVEDIETLAWHELDSGYSLTPAVEFEDDTQRYLGYTDQPMYSFIYNARHTNSEMGHFSVSQLLSYIENARAKIEFITADIKKKEDEEKGESVWSKDQVMDRQPEALLEMIQAREDLYKGKSWLGYRLWMSSEEFPSHDDGCCDMD